MTHPEGTGNDGEVRVADPHGTGIVTTYASQCERDRSLRLAQAQQELAARGAGLPGWQDLTGAEQEDTALEARNWLHAGEASGLITPCPARQRNRLVTAPPRTGHGAVPLGDAVARFLDRYRDEKGTRVTYTETLAHLLAAVGGGSALVTEAGPQAYAAVMSRWDDRAPATWNKHLAALVLRRLCDPPGVDHRGPRPAPGTPEGHPAGRQGHPAGTAGSAVHRRPARPSRTGAVAAAV